MPKTRHAELRSLEIVAPVKPVVNENWVRVIVCTYSSVFTITVNASHARLHDDCTLVL